MSYTITEPTLRDIAWEGKGSIIIHVQGLETWRENLTINVDINRKEYSEDTPTGPWTYSISGGSYGITPTSADGWKNYGLALQEAGRKIEQYIALEDKMDLIFQEGQSFRKAEAERIAREEQAAREADPVVGAKLANRVINEMRRIAKTDLSRWEEATIRCFERGTHKERVIKVTHSYKGLTLFSLQYQRISRKRAVDYVADSNLNMLEVTGIGMPDPKVVNFLLSKSKK